MRLERDMMKKVTWGFGHSSLRERKILANKTSESVDSFEEMIEL
jgi:hypothetical protein